ncbi:hypothetical protein F53441_11040 [Fusarium austroafricanum]|uniref:Uncharacterized protein n=1 Tax=Fusarium austroafricanum TaxID=2364996 RepID=A0A8H4K503_9HYPO|nr:hypothetical protein F53441_11040 [Fusarium austroafricanum]
MVFLNQIADAFSEYQYDESTRFDRIDGVPCFACVSEIHRDLDCVCIRGKNATTCLYCEHYKIKCGPMPRELLGVAQWYWNTLTDFEVQHPIGRGKDERNLTPVQVGRVRCALIACGRAWRGLAGHLKKPYPEFLPEFFHFYVVPALIVLLELCEVLFAISAHKECLVAEIDHVT